MAAPTVQQFKDQFAREFPYGARKDQVMTADITRALNEAAPMFNDALWTDDTERVIAYCYAAAHYLVLNIRAAGGLSNEQGLGGGLNSSGGAAVLQKSVGGVSLSYALPDRIVQSPILSGFMRTDFGLRYLQMLAPRLVGGGFVVPSGSDTDQDQVL